MALPFVMARGFEAGVHGFTATSGALIDVPHYSELARQGMAPYRGSYCLRIRLAGGTTSQFLREDTAFDDLIATTRRFVRCYFYLGKDLVMADTDKFSLFEAESTLNTTTEVAFGIDRSGDNIRLWYAETAAATAQTFTLGTTATALGKWYHFELNILLDSGVGNDGTLDGYLEDGIGTQITAIDQAAIVDAKFGVIGPDAGTSGTILIDDIVYDDTQIFRDKERFRVANAHIVQASDHVFVGPGTFSAAVTATGTDGVLSLYDSDGVPTNLSPIAVIRNVSANEFTPGHDIFQVSHGLYATLTGTAPQAFISMEKGGLWSDATIIGRGLRTGGPRP